MGDQNDGRQVINISMYMLDVRDAVVEVRGVRKAVVALAALLIIDVALYLHHANYINYRLGSIGYGGATYTETPQQSQNPWGWFVDGRYFDVLAEAFRRHSPRGLTGYEVRDELRKLLGVRLAKRLLETACGTRGE